MGIVYMFKESETLLQNYCGKKPQKWVQHSPFNRPAKILISWFSQSHDVFKIMNFILFPLQIIVYFTDCIFFTDFSSGFQITVSLKCCPFFLITEYADIPNLVFNFLKYCRRPRTLLIRPSVRPSITKTTVEVKTN